MIKRATIEDIPRLKEIGLCFAKENKVSAFNIDIFIKKWSDFFKQQIGIIFIAYKEELVVGAIGGLIYPDMWTDELILTEIFWVVLPEYRGFDFLGLTLFSTFEQYARDSNIKKIIIGHMMTVNPEKMEKAFLFKGYKPIEKYYMREVI